MINVSIRIPTKAQPKTMQSALTEVIGNTAAKLESEARNLSSKTVDTGRFRSGWVATQQVDQNSFNINLKNSADYAIFVHEKNTSKSDTVIKRDIIPAMEATASKLAKDAARILADHAMAIMLDALRGV